MPFRTSKGAVQHAAAPVFEPTAGRQRLRACERHAGAVAAGANLVGAAVRVGRALDAVARFAAIARAALAVGDHAVLAAGGFVAVVVGADVDVVAVRVVRDVRNGVGRLVADVVGARDCVAGRRPVDAQAAVRVADLGPIAELSVRALERLLAARVGLAARARERSPSVSGQCASSKQATQAPAPSHTPLPVPPPASGRSSHSAPCATGGCCIRSWACHSGLWQCIDPVVAVGMGVAQTCPATHGVETDRSALASPIGTAHQGIRSVGDEGMKTRSAQLPVKVCRTVQVLP